MNEYELEDMYCAYKDAADDVFEAMGKVDEAIEKLASLGDNCKSLKDMKDRLGEMSTKLERILDDLAIDIADYESFQEEEDQ